MQPRTSLSTKSLLVRDMIRDLLKSFGMILSNVGVWGLAVTGVLILDNADGETSVAVTGGSAVPDE